MPKGNSMAIFVHEQHIERYQRLLQVQFDVQHQLTITLASYSAE